MSKDDKKVRVVLFVTDGLITDCVTDSKVDVEYLVVSNSPADLDQSIQVLMEPQLFDYADHLGLFSVYGDQAYLDTQKVESIYKAREEQGGLLKQVQ